MGIVSKLENLSGRQYAAAKATRLTGDWFPVNQDINTIIRSSSPTLRARTRQLVRDFPFFNRAINTLTNYSIGPSGMVFQSRVQTGDKDADKAIRTQIEDAVQWAYEEIDAAGRLQWGEIERLLKRQDIENGELLFVKTTINDPKRFIPYAIQVYEADWLTSFRSQPISGNEIDQGIEFDPRTGKVLAYHFAQPSGYTWGAAQINTPVRVPAENVIHNFHSLRPGQLRGVSPFTTAILVAHDLGDYLDAEIDGAKMAAKYLAFIETGDIAGFQNMRGAENDDTGKKLENIENAAIEYLRSGEKITIANHNRPGANFAAFCEFVLRMVAISTDTTYELLTADYNGINYSNLRGIRNDYAVAVRPHSVRHILNVAAPVHKDIIHWAQLSGKLKLPGYWDNPRKYWRGTYTPPGMESIDPLREGKAWIEQIKAGLRSPQEITASRGRDYEEVLDEIAEAKKMAEDRGLDWNALFDVSTAMQQNPAKVGASEE